MLTVCPPCGGGVIPGPTNSTLAVLSLSPVWGVILMIVLFKCNTNSLSPVWEGVILTKKEETEMNEEFVPRVGSYSHLLDQGMSKLQVCSPCRRVILILRLCFQNYLNLSSMRGVIPAYHYLLLTINQFVPVRGSYS